MSDIKMLSGQVWNSRWRCGMWLGGLSTFWHYILSIRRCHPVWFSFILEKKIWIIWEIRVDWRSHEKNIELYERIWILWGSVV